MHVTPALIPSPRRPGTVEPATGGSLRERRERRRQPERRPVVVHVPIPLASSDAYSVVKDTYSTDTDRCVVDLYL